MGAWERRVRDELAPSLRAYDTPFQRGLLKIRGVMRLTPLYVPEKRVGSQMICIHYMGDHEKIQSSSSSISDCAKKVID